MGLRKIAEGAFAPTDFAVLPGGSRKFVLDQPGVIRVLEDGGFRDDPFLDIRDRVVDLKYGHDERGILGPAFHPDLVERYEAGGGDGPRIAETKVCWAESDEDARETAYEWWPQAGLPAGATELPTPAHFDEAVADVSEAEVADAFVTGPDPNRYVDHLEAFVDAGFDRIYVHQLGPDQEGFFEFWRDELRPRST